MKGTQTDGQAQTAAGVLLGLGAEVEFQPDPTPRGRAGLPIGRVALQQFGSHADTDLAFTQPVTFIVGPNGHGKTTIVEALLWALTGRYARGTDGRGANTGELIRTGHTAARVTVHTSGAGDVLREVKGGKVRLLIEEQTVTEPDAQLAIYARMRTTEGRLRAVCHGATLLDADHAAGKDLLLDVLQVRVTVGAQTYTLPQLDAAYDKAFDDRKAAKRDRDAIRVPARPEQPAPDVAALEQRLADYREEEKRLIAASAETDGTRRQLHARVASLTSQRDRLQGEIDASASVHDDLDRLEQRLTELRAAPEPSADVDGDLTTLREQLVTASGRLRLLEDAVAGIASHSPTKGCVIDAAIPCKTSAKAFGDALTTLRSDLEQLREEVRTTQPRIQELEALARGREQAAGVRQRQIAAVEQDRSRLQSRARMRQADEARIAEVRADLEELEAELAACGPVAEASPRLAEVRASITKGETEVLPAARRLVDAWRVYEDAQRRALEAGQTAERLEQLVEQLGPKGARVAALTAAVAAFTDRINTYLQRFGLTLAIEIEPWCVRVNGRPASRLSASERFRVGACLQLALADYTGLHLAVIDNADVLVTPDARAAFNALAIEWALAAPGRQVIVVAAKEDAWRIPAIPGTAVYRVRQDADGISRVTRESEHGVGA